MDAKRQFTPLEIESAWENAEAFPGQDPAKLRIDNVLDAGVSMYRDRFGTPEGYRSKGGYWVIDEQGRARHAGYQFKEAMHAERNRLKLLEQATVERQRSRNAEKAAAAGLPNSEIFDRLDALEAALAKLQKT